MADAGRNGPTRLRWILAISCAIQFLDVALITALSPLLPHYADELGIGPAQSGRLVASFAVGAMLLAFPAGVLVGRAGVKRTAVLGLALMGAASIGFGLADSTLALEGARFGQGAASSIAWTAGISWLTGSVPRDRRGRYLGLQASVTVSGALAGPGIGVLAAHTGTRWTFGAIGGVCLALGFVALRLPDVGATRQPFRRAFRALRHPALALGVWLYLLPSLLGAAQNAVAPLRLSDAGWGVGAIGTVFVVSAAVQGGLNPLIGRWLDHVDRWIPLAISLALSTALATVLALPGTDGRLMLAALVGLASIAFVSFYLLGSKQIADGSDATGLEHAYGFTLANAAWAPGAIAGAVAGGELAGRFGNHAPYALLAGLCMVTFAAAWWLRARGSVLEGP